MFSKIAQKFSIECTVMRKSFVCKGEFEWNVLDISIFSYREYVCGENWQTNRFPAIIKLKAAFIARHTPYPATYKEGGRAWGVISPFYFNKFLHAEKNIFSGGGYPLN